MVIVTVEHDQLLLPVRRVVEGVDIEREVVRRRVERLEEQIHEHVAEPPQIGDGDGVLEAGEGGLAGQVAVLGEPVGEELEDGVGAQGVVIVLVLVVGEDAVDALADHAQEGLLRQGGIAWVVERGGELLSEAKLLVALPDRDEPGVAGQRCGGDLDLDRTRRQKIEGQERDSL